jgi:hypothetical protein
MKLFFSLGNILNASPSKFKHLWLTIWLLKAVSVENLYKHLSQGYNVFVVPFLINADIDGIYK